MTTEKTVKAQDKAGREKSGAPIPTDEVHIDDLLEEMISREASDLHVCVGVPPVVRVDGQLLPLNFGKFAAADTQRIIYDILSDEQIRRFEERWELDFSYAVKSIARFRVNAYRDKGSIAAAFRLIPTKIPTIRELELPVILEALTRKPRGLVLVTGPTGSGKSTTLAAMINQINSERSTHIISIEDPIEYLHQHRFSVINQREVGQDTKDFAGALRSALREDPDVILVGEMRDLETISLAITAAETGHLVLASLHTSSAAQTVDRIIDSFPAQQQEQVRLMLSNSLEAVLCQQLLPRVETSGRICAMEVMIATPAIRNLIREAKTHQIASVIQTSASSGMQTLDQHLRELYQRYLVNYDDVMAVAMNPEELKTMISMTNNSSGPMNFR
ncbi:type IV pilus twitching motility protein PilT [bacterium]|nr:type IV pilus twitching motility protein PilT [bacterium]